MTGSQTLPSGLSTVASSISARSRIAQRPVRGLGLQLLSVSSSVSGRRRVVDLVHRLRPVFTLRRVPRQVRVLARRPLLVCTLRRVPRRVRVLVNRLLMVNALFCVLRPVRVLGHQRVQVYTLHLVQQQVRGRVLVLRRGRLFMPVQRQGRGLAQRHLKSCLLRLAPPRVRGLVQARRLDHRRGRGWRLGRVPVRLPLQGCTLLPERLLRPL